MNEAIAFFTEGKTDREVARLVADKHGLELTSKSPVIREAKKMYIMQMEVPTKEYYLRESLADYDQIKEDANDVADLKEGLKLKVAVLRDRNELIGLSKAGVNIEVNFNSKNLSDSDFITNQNVVDVVAVEEVKFEKPNERTIEEVEKDVLSEE